MTRNHTLWGILEDHILLRDSDGVPILVDIDTGEGIWLEELKGYTYCVTLDDSILLNNHDNAPALVELAAGDVVDCPDMQGYTVELLDGEGNQALMKASRKNEEDLLYLYDAESQQLYLLNPQEEDSEHREIIDQAWFALGSIWYSKKIDNNSTALYQIDREGTLLTQWELPADESIETFAVGDDYMICVTKSSVPDAETPECVLTYYHITVDGDVEPIYEWPSIDDYGPINCQVICDGDLVISGCAEEEHRIRFWVEEE